MIQYTSQQEYIIQKAIDWFYNSDEQLFQYAGGPGTGKSFILMEIVKRLGLDIENEVAPMSYIGAAALNMRKYGLVSAKTIHSWLFEIREIPETDSFGHIVYNDNGKISKVKVFLPKDMLPMTIRLIIIDEAFCVPLSLKQYIMKHGIKVLACGDTHQLPPVADSPAFLISGEIYKLTEIMRQSGRDDIIQIAIARYNDYKVTRGRSQNALVIDRNQLTDEMLLWADEIICGKNSTRDNINNHIRYIKGYHSILPMYGEKLVCRNNNWDLISRTPDGYDMALVNGIIGTVTNQPSISSYNKNNHSIPIEFMCNDISCSFLANASYEYFLSNSEERKKIKSINSNRKSKSTQLFEFAYAITCHIAQGSQFDKVIYIEESMYGDIQAPLNLVGATRAVKQLIYVLDDGYKWHNLSEDTALEQSKVSSLQSLISSKYIHKKKTYSKSLI